MSPSLISNLESSRLREAANAATILNNGAQLEQETTSKGTAEALLETYQQRVNHLSQFTSHHARRLLRATEEFCANLNALQADQSVAYARADDPLLGSYIIWYDTQALEPVGCLYVIGKSELPDEAWEGLWNND